MKFVGLLSGGKDSMYAVSKAIGMGHECVCVASLFSATEKDSFMFQTTGTNLVSALARAIGKPLCSRRLQGASLCQTMHYSPTGQDEVEDLLLLLQDVKWRFPDVQAVVSGAVLSDYQRLRVEHVCRELGLLSVSPLWQMGQSDLLNEMIEAGFEAVLVKISAVGLTPSHLNKPISELRECFEELVRPMQHKRFGFNVCGEGGEYETLMIDAPFFKKRLVVQESTLHDAEYSVCMPTAHLTITKAALLDKETGELEEAETCLFTPSVPVYRHADYFSSGELTAKGMGYDPESIEEEAFLVLKGLQQSLEDQGLSLSQVFYVHAYISDMSQFARFNSVYAKFFGFNSPPARFCIQLAQDVRVKLFVQGSTHPKNAIQVASVSSWAPAAIGPYSQAVQVEETLHMAGMIPLDPVTMNISPDGLAQTFKSLNRVAGLLKFAVRQPQLCVVYYTESCPTVSPDLFPCYVKVTGLPKACDHEVELHINRKPPRTAMTSHTESNLSFTVRVSSQKSSEMVWGVWIVEVDSLSNPDELVIYLRSILQSYLQGVRHVSMTERHELLNSRNWVPKLEKYVKEFRVYDPAPYQYKQGWLEEVPSVFLHSESRVLVVVLEDAWQLATQRFIGSGD
jgi:diphthine-ammonia ligase